MKKHGVGCVVLLVALAAVAVFVDQQTNAHLPPELRFFVAGTAALLLTLGLSNFWTLLRGYGQGDASRAAVLERARTGEAPQQDGPIVATGVVRAEGSTLRAPLSGIECVAYQYRLYILQPSTRGRPNELPIYWGYASRLFRLDTPRQAFRVIAVPQLADESTPHESSESRERVKAYVAATRFEPKQAFAGIASAAITMFRELMNEPSGEVRRDWQLADANIEFNRLLMEETVLPVGATVSVSGHWSAERRAIVAEGPAVVTVKTGAAEELGRSGSSELPWSVLSVAATGTLLLLLGAGLVWLSTTGRLAEWWRTH